MFDSKWKSLAGGFFYSDQSRILEIIRETLMGKKQDLIMDEQGE